MRNQPYDLNLTLEQNLLKGPPSIPTNLQIPKTKATLWMGQKLLSPFGIAASPLTMNPAWIEWGSKMGYDFITYKTVRSRSWASNNYPNWLVVDGNSFDENLGQIKTSKPFQSNEISMANSFGVQSPEPEVWMAEYEKSKSFLQEGQILVLSIMPTIIHGENILQDIDRLSDYVNQTSAELVEINLACPNSENNLIFFDVNLSIAIIKNLRSRLDSNKKLLVKLGYYPNQKDLHEFVKGTVGQITAITSINTVGMNISNEDNTPAFGKGRIQAGVSGAVIRPYALHQMAKLVLYRKEFSLEDDLGLIAVGGVSKPEHIHQFLSQGNNIVVQATTGVWENPMLAIEFKQSMSEQ